MTTTTRSLAELVDELNRLDASEITIDSVAERIAQTEVDDPTLAPYLSFQTGRYTRNLVHRSELFDVIILCWMPGQRTPIHNHSGQLGWVRVLRGALEEHTFATRPVGRRDEAAGDACLFASRVALEETGRAVYEASRAVVSVDTERAVHRLGNPAATRGCNAVSLHVYSRPHDSCLTYDPETGAVKRVQLSFDAAPDSGTDLKA